MSSDDFVHDIAIDISRALNLTNPNDLIAKKVIQFAETNKDFDKFSKGKWVGYRDHLKGSHSAKHLPVCSTFGRFSKEFLAETYTKISNQKQNEKRKPSSSNSNATPVQPVVDATRNEVLVLGNNLPGGLITKKNKSSKADEERPIFKVPALPNKSLLGLDELARKKRLADAAAVPASTTAEKKIKMSWDDEGDGEKDSTEDEDMKSDKIQTSRPHYRSQRMETPSNPGGISESALKRMEDMKRRDRHRGSRHDNRSSRDDHRSSRDDRGRREDRGRRDDRDRDRDRYGRDRDRDDRSKRSDDRHSTPSSSREGSETPGRRGGLIKRSQWTSMTPQNQGAFTPRQSTGNMTPGRHDSGIRQSTGAATAAVRRTWDYMTPAVRSTAYDEVALEYPEEFEGDEEDRRRWEEEQAQLDREWYQMEDNGAADDTHNAFADYESHDQHKEQELAQKQMKKLSARQAQYNRDTDMWEASRMLSSGVAQQIEVDTDFDEENEVGYTPLACFFRQPLTVCVNRAAYISWSMISSPPSWMAAWCSPSSWKQCNTSETPPQTWPLFLERAADLCEKRESKQSEPKPASSTLLVPRWAT